MTNLITPHIFANLTGFHKFTVPSAGPDGHKFVHWRDPSDSITQSTTITVYSEGTYTAYYDVGPCKYVTPTNPELIEIASNSSWVDILDYVSSEISFGDNTNWQVPIETLTKGSGQCRDYATLCVSLLRSCGYKAYVALGRRKSSGSTEGHAWVVFGLNETLVHLEPQSNFYSQQFVNFTNYQAQYYFNENGIFSPAPSKDPPIYTSEVEETNLSLLFFSVIFVGAINCALFVFFKVTKKR